MNPQIRVAQQNNTRCNPKKQGKCPSELAEKQSRNVKTQFCPPKSDQISTRTETAMIQAVLPVSVEEHRKGKRFAAAPDEIRLNPPPKTPTETT
jgi:hypothetical protein